jgi:hypothetical protein
MQKSDLEWSRIEVIPSYFSKETFGDADILIDLKLTKEQIHVLFDPNEIVVNGPVTSFDYKGLQVDFIYSPRDEFEYALAYYSYNDLGNLIGKLAHKFGLKHGHDGLWLPVRDGEQMIGQVRLTLSPYETLGFLGLYEHRYALGFDDLDEIFNFVATSPYYHPDLYKLENLNHIARIRDKKRDTYRKFLEFGEKQPPREPYNFHEDKHKYVPLILNTFPDAKAGYDELVGNLLIRRAAAEKFNGNLVSELTGLEKIDLGKLMAVLKKLTQFRPSLVVLTPQEDLNSLILKVAGS